LSFVFKIHFIVDSAAIDGLNSSPGSTSGDIPDFATGPVDSYPDFEKAKC
jgi:hypothetical protein